MYSILSTAGADTRRLRDRRTLVQTHSTPIEPHALGERIAALRRGHGWTQRRLAEAAGVSNGYIALLELGRLSSPGKFRLDAIARALSLRTSDSLLSGDRKSTRLNSSHGSISYAVLCLK